MSSEVASYGHNNDDAIITNYAVIFTEYVIVFSNYVQVRAL